MLQTKYKYAFAALFSLGALTGCMTPVEDLRPTTFEAGNLDTSAENRIVTILHLMPAKAKVDNTVNNQTAEQTGSAVGAVACGVAAGVTAGIFAGSGAGVGAGIGGAYLCSMIGSWIGDAIEPPVLHPDSLVIAYQDPNNPQIFQTVEIARPCEFKPGTASAVILKNAQTGKEETKIQPNNFQACLSYKEKIKQAKEEDKAAKKIAEKERSQRIKHPNAPLPPTELPAGNVTRIDQDGTVLLNGRYLGVVNEEGSVKTLDSDQNVQISRDGVVRDRTDPNHEVILGNVSPEQLEQIRACKNKLPTCKLTHVGW